MQHKDSAVIEHDPRLENASQQLIAALEIGMPACDLQF